jgi:hypothetical protein
MLSQDVRNKIQNITSGIIIKGASDHCTTIRNLLSGRYPASTNVKADFEGKSVTKEEQAKLICDYSDHNKLWVDLPDQYLTRGGEARVYLAPGNKDVIKVNDGIYYATWLEFFNSILLHNIFFENTGYSLLGFHKEDEVLYAVLKQPYIISDHPVELSEIKVFLEFNGFVNTRRQDYVNNELGLILEDMHDENVILCKDLLFFIDSVFYIIEPMRSVSSDVQ